MILTIHERALAAAKNYRRSESELLEIICEVRKHTVYLQYETSLFAYCVNILKLDPGVVYGFMAVAKKIVEVPELHREISAGALNVATAKRITSVITQKNATEWIVKAQSLTVKQLEREVAIANPKTEVKERVQYLVSKRVKLETGLNETLMLQIRHIQNLESQKQRKSVSLEETLEAMAKAYLDKHDPIVKAKRATIRGLTQKAQNPSARKESRKRTPIPAAIKHAINLRDKLTCQHPQCSNQRFIEIHHVKPVSQGGKHSVDNLITLCSEHHKQLHKH